VQAQPVIDRSFSAKTLAKESPKSARIDETKTGSKEARDEIHAYVAIRDLLLSDAEKAPTQESLRRASMANEFVETCLQTARSPYEAQCLDEEEAVRERERCNAAKMRIATLHQRISLVR